MSSAGHRKQQTVELKLNIVVKSANKVGIYSDGKGLEIYLLFSNYRFIRYRYYLLVFSFQIKCFPFNERMMREC